MPLLHPGDTFPQLTLNIPGAQAIQVPGWFAGEFGVVLFDVWRGSGGNSGLSREQRADGRPQRG